MFGTLHLTDRRAILHVWFDAILNLFDFKLTTSARWISETRGQSTSYGQTNVALASSQVSIASKTEQIQLFVNFLSARNDIVDDIASFPRHPHPSEYKT